MVWLISWFFPQHIFFCNTFEPVSIVLCKHQYQPWMPTLLFLDICYQHRYYEYFVCYILAFDGVVWYDIATLYLYIDTWKLVRVIRCYNGSLYNFINTFCLQQRAIFFLHQNAIKLFFFFLSLRKYCWKCKQYKKY